MNTTKLLERSPKKCLTRSPPGSEGTFSQSPNSCKEGKSSTKPQIIWKRLLMKNSARFISWIFRNGIRRSSKLKSVGTPKRKWMILKWRWQTQSLIIIIQRWIIEFQVYAVGQPIKLFFWETAFYIFKNSICLTWNQFGFTINILF